MTAVKLTRRATRVLGASRATRSDYILSGIQLATAMFVATYVGVTARIYLQMLAQWSGFSEFESLYAQLVGSAILGVISAHKQVQKFFLIIYSLSLMQMLYRFL